jgi:hypothetical protein
MKFHILIVYLYLYQGWAKYGPQAKSASKAFCPAHGVVFLIQGSCNSCSFIGKLKVFTSPPFKTIKYLINSCYEKINEIVLKISKGTPLSTKESYLFSKTQILYKKKRNQARKGI